jgi:hypothetical protein
MNKAANSMTWCAVPHNVALSATPAPFQSGSQDAIERVRSSKLIIAKFQVPLSTTGSVLVLGYDEKRNLNVQVSQANCAQHARLVDTIRRRGLMGGLKAYFNVYLSEDRSELVILVDDPLPMQSW